MVKQMVVMVAAIWAGCGSGGGEATPSAGGTCAPAGAWTLTDTLENTDCPDSLGLVEGASETSTVRIDEQQDGSYIWTEIAADPGDEDIPCDTILVVTETRCGAIVTCAIRFTSEPPTDVELKHLVDFTGSDLSGSSTVAFKREGNESLDCGATARLTGKRR